ncbi:MAG TPA: hypothetical protein VGE07_20115 [Herpetosiphonaceae bacterium]
MYKIPAAVLNPPPTAADRAAYRLRRRFLIAGLLVAAAIAVHYRETTQLRLSQDTLAPCSEPVRIWIIAVVAIPAILLVAGLAILALHHSPDARRSRRFTGAIAGYWIALMLFVITAIIIRPWESGRGLHIAGLSLPCDPDNASPSLH